MKKLMFIVIIAFIFLSCSKDEISKYRNDYLVSPELFQAYKSGVISYNRYLKAVERELKLKKIYGIIK